MMVRADFRHGRGKDDLQRIGACMLGAVAPASLAHEAVLDFEMSLLRQGWPVGQSLGALLEVRTQLGIGRPAFREAVTILEARGLLDVRRGPGGGLFVSAPAPEDVASALLMYLALAGETHACIQEFRLLVWRMVITAALQRGVPQPRCGISSGEWGFAADLAEQTGNTTMVLLARLTEMLIRISYGIEAAPARDRELEGAMVERDLPKALGRLDRLAGPVNEHAPIVALEVAERAFSLSGRKSAMALAAQMAHELGVCPGMPEAEWETAERLGYTDAIVRQARRILQDFGIVRCRQGRKGVELAPHAAPTAVIRLLAPCLVASATSVADNREAIAFLISGAPVLAARRVRSDDRAVVRLLSSSSPEGFEALMLENLLLELSGNPLLAIVVRSLGLATIFAAGDPVAPADEGAVIPLNRRILAAIEVGDVDAAGVLAGVKLQVMQQFANNYQAVA